MVGRLDARASPGVTVRCRSLRSRVPSFVCLCRDPLPHMSVSIVMTPSRSLSTCVANTSTMVLPSTVTQTL